MLNQVNARDNRDLRKQGKSVIELKKNENSFSEFAESVAKIEESLFNLKGRYNSVQRIQGGILISSRDSSRFLFLKDSHKI